MHQSPFTKVGPNKKTCQLCHTLTPTDYKLWWQCFLQFGDDIVFQMFCCDILEPHFGGMFAHIGTLCHASHFPPGSTCHLYLLGRGQPLLAATVCHTRLLPRPGVAVLVGTPGCCQDTPSIGFPQHILPSLPKPNIQMPAHHCTVIVS